MSGASGDVPEPQGVWTGRWATNPVTGQAVGVWVGDYVLMGFGARPCDAKVILVAVSLSLQWQGLVL